MRRANGPVLGRMASESYHLACRYVPKGDIKKRIRTVSRWSSLLHRRQFRDGEHPASELWTAIGEIAETALCRDVKSGCEGQVRHGRGSLHQRIGHTVFKYIGHALGTEYL